MTTHGRIIFGVVQILAAVSSVAFAADGEIGKLALVNGEVRITKDAANAGRVAKPGDSIVNTDVIKTNDNASAKILFTDQSVIDVGPNAALKVSDYALKDGDNRTGTFSLLYGKMRALVTKKVGPQGKVEVRSGQTVMGVRGTEFMVDTPKGGGQTTLVVASGMVSVTPPGATSPISVNAGQMLSAGPRASTATTAATAAAGGGSKDSKASDTGTSASSSGSGNAQVTQVSSEQMQTLVGTSKAADNTFQGAVKIDTTGTSTNTTTMIASGGPLTLPPPPPPPPPAPPSLPGPVTLVGPLLPPIPGQLVHLSVGIQ